MKTTIHAGLARLPGAALAVLVLATLAAPPAWSGERAVPREGDAPQVKAASNSSGAARTRSSSSGSRSSGSATRGSSSAGRSSGRSAVSRTRPSSPRASSAGRTRVDRNPDRYRGRRPFHRTVFPHHRAFGHFYLGYYYPYWYWPWGYWGVGPNYYPPYYRTGYGHGDDLGALDLDLSPGKAEIWLDGNYIGVADNFDGFPTYLWLPEGTYDLVFYKEGFRTIHRQYSIYPGLVIDVEDRMERGESIPPQQLMAPKTTERRDERLRRDAERREEAAGRLPAADQDPYDARAEPGRLVLAVRPADASVYLDGRFLGTAGELAELHAGLIVDPGEHRLEVVRPGYSGQGVDFAVAEGEEVSIEVALESEGSASPAAR